MLIFYNNRIFTDWNKNTENNFLIDYILPEEDLEDLNIIKNKFETIEKYDFKEITRKYNLDNSIIALIFKNKNKIRILSRITSKEDIILKNQSYDNIDITKEIQAKDLINNLKNIYEDYWKNLNQVNTSIRLNLNIKINSLNNTKISNFEKTLNETDLIYDFFITKFDNNYIYYQIIYNGTPDNFLKSMGYNNYQFNTQNKIWELK